MKTSSQARSFAQGNPREPRGAESRMTTDLYETDATAWAEAHSDALRRRATNEAETGLVAFPSACPWTIDQVLDPAFWPDDAA